MMLYLIVMDIIDMPVQVVLILNDMIPKTALPYMPAA